MAGEYNDAIRPTLPGAYTRYIAQRPAQPPPAPGTLVALPITHDWGPMDEATLITDYGHFQAGVRHRRGRVRHAGLTRGLRRVPRRGHRRDRRRGRRAS
jgi:hypothetical protein